MRNALSRNLQKSINSSLLYVREFHREYHVVTIVPKKKIKTSHMHLVSSGREPFYLR